MTNPSLKKNISDIIKPIAGGISKVNVTTRLEFELAYPDVTVPYAKETLPCLVILCRLVKFKPS